MILRARNHRSGVALIVVMMVIVALGILAGTFAYTMKVETTLARSATSESEMDWLGRSGVEMARYVLGIQMTVPNEGNYDALCQKWAGGPLGTNETLMNISLDDIQVGRGKISIKMIDLERKVNINLADQVILTQALKVMGVDVSAQTPIVNSILDWRDTDDYTLTDGTESDYYMSLSPPYMAKNGPLDDISELLLIRGITEQPEIYWGADATNVMTLPVQSGPLSRMKSHEPITYPVGLKDLFTTIGQRTINVNTASSFVLQLIPTIDENVASSIIAARAGPDGVEGNEDDTPFRTSADFSRVPAFAMAMQTGQSSLANLLNVRSATFQVTVTAELAGRKAVFVAIVARQNPQNIHILSFVRN